MRYGEIPGVNKPVARGIQGSTMIGTDLEEAAGLVLLDQAFDLSWTQLICMPERGERII